MRRHDRPTMGVIATLALAITLAACTSGPGPLAQPDVSQAALVRAAAGWLAGSDRLTDAPVYVLDRTDPGVATRMRATPEFRDQSGQPEAGGPLEDASRQAIRDGIGADRPVEFVADRADVPPGKTVTFTGDLGCTLFLDGGTYLALAPVRAQAVHGDVYLVAVELADGCGSRWLALRLVWQPGSPVGGRWEVTDVIDGGGISV